MSKSKVDENQNADSQLRVVLAHIPDSFNSVAWSPDGSQIATGSDDSTVRLWNATSGQLIRTLEGHTDSVSSVAFSPDGRHLASASWDKTVRVWESQSGEELKVYAGERPTHFVLDASFRPPLTNIATMGKTVLGDDDIIVQTFNLTAESFIPTGTTTRIVSAKIVLVGESEVGKSCLALRLAQGRYEEQGTTHGMQIWKMSPEQLSQAMAAPASEKRELVIWDLGGQPEYRLIHQLFLHDTTVALMLLDPTRGSKAFDDVREWNLRLEKQLRGRAAIKLLVGTKLDEENALVDHAALESLKTECGCSDYFSTSAKVPRGLEALCAALAEQIKWDALSQTTRPKLFQRIRDAVDEHQQRGDVVLLYADLEKQIRDEDPELFDAQAVNVVVEQLRLQGAIAESRLASGERVLVLQLGYIEQYAGSLIVTAKTSPRGIPVIEEAAIASGKMEMPGIKPAERLHPFQELVVLQCVVQLLIEHGICLKHEGVLIFPNYFPETTKEDEQKTPHTISLYYDFMGAIENIYSSLIVSLALSKQFGRYRLWKNRAEYEQPGQGVCGLRKIDRKGGLAHLDLLFSDDVPDETRNLFTVFVEEHLQNQGVEIKEILAITCGHCSYEFEEGLVRDRIADNQQDVICPRCEKRLPISEGAKKMRATDSTIERELFALKTVIEEKKQADVREVKKVFAAARREDGNPIRILHLSDLHLRPDDDLIVRLQPLISDLQDHVDGLGFDRLDYLVVSGDLTNRASAEEFNQVYEFTSQLIKAFNLSSQRVILVPGNHDLSWDTDVYGWKQRRKVDVKKLKEGCFVPQGDGYLIRDEANYHRRFENFGKFYHELIQEPYPLEPEEQCVSLLFDDTRIQFIALNSASEIDEYFPERSAINEGALARGLTKAREQIERAKKENRIKPDANVLRLAVWHHPVTGNEKINKDAFLDQLQQEEIKLCLHGHIHEDRADLVGYLHPTQRLCIAGAGSFGAPADARPEAMPRLYNVLEVWRDHSKIRVHTRCLKKVGGAWEGWAVWPDPSNSRSRLTYYDIEL